MAQDTEPAVTPSSGNVFADLGLSNPEADLLKSELVIQIRRSIEAKGWTQTQAAAHIGLPQSSVSLLLRGRLSGFSVERLLTILNRLGYDVEVRIAPAQREAAESRVSMT